MIRIAGFHAQGGGRAHLANIARGGFAYFAATMAGANPSLL